MFLFKLCDLGLPQNGQVRPPGQIKMFKIAPGHFFMIHRQYFQ